MGFGMEEMQLFARQLQSHRLTNTQAPIRLDAGRQRQTRRLTST